MALFGRTIKSGSCCSGGSLVPVKEPANGDKKEADKPADKCCKTCC